MTLASSHFAGQFFCSTRWPKDFLLQVDWFKKAKFRLSVIEAEFKAEFSLAEPIKVEKETFRLPDWIKRVKSALRIDENPTSFHVAFNPPLIAGADLIGTTWFRDMFENKIVVVSQYHVILLSVLPFLILPRISSDLAKISGR